jgi:uncharacterized coiled-coil protein SlyX
MADAKGKTRGHGKAPSPPSESNNGLPPDVAEAVEKLLKTNSECLLMIRNLKKTITEQRKTLEENRRVMTDLLGNVEFLNGRLKEMQGAEASGDAPVNYIS